jgi:DNA-binding response OmpR family regulator
MKVLILSEDVAARSLRAALLGAAGATTITADSGFAALQTLYRETDIALVVADRSGGALDGAGFLRELRADALFRRLPALMVVPSHGDLDAICDALRCGADDYIAEPLDPDEFLEKIRVLARIRRVGLTAAFP